MMITAAELNSRTVDALLNNDKRALRSLAKVVVRSAVLRCVDCGSSNMQDNGCPSTSCEYTTLCVDCGSQNSPNM